MKAATPPVPDTTRDMLEARSVTMWGNERTAANQENLDMFAFALNAISQRLPPRDQQPAFYIF